MELSENIQEILEKLWTALEEEKRDSISLDELDLNGQEREAQKLIDIGLLKASGDLLEFTAEGRRQAESAIRRHRLAERLMNDVLEARQGSMEQNACKFEHLLYEGMDDSICTLLGHPKFCPHGRPIPPGECCYKGKDAGGLLVASLSDLNPGQSGKIAYIQARQSQEIQKLMAIGVLPGTPIQLIRRYPSFVFEVGNTQYAVDKNIANLIYVRLTNDSVTDIGTSQQPSRGRRRWRKGKGI